MLVTVVRSYVPEVVTLPDGNQLKPFKFVEYCPLPESMRGEALKELVDAGKVKVAQVQSVLPSKDDVELPESVVQSGLRKPPAPENVPEGVVPRSAGSLVTPSA